jgi:hypothetical protein
MVLGVKMAKMLGEVSTSSGSTVVYHLPIHLEVKDLSCVAADGIRCANGKEL